MISRVQFARGGGTTISSFTITLGSAPANGNTVLVIVLGNVATVNNNFVTSITATGMTFVKDKMNQVNSDVEIWRASNVSGAGTVITVNVNTNANGDWIGYAIEYSGLKTSPLDKTAGNNGSSTTPDSGTTSLTIVPSELWIAGLEQITGSATFSFPTNGFTIIDQHISTGFQVGAILEKITMGTGTAHTSVTSTANATWTGAIATYKGPSHNKVTYLGKKRIKIL